MNKHNRVRRSCYEHRAGTIARNVPNDRGEVGHWIQRPHGFAANSWDPWRGISSHQEIQAAAECRRPAIPV